MREQLASKKIYLIIKRFLDLVLTLIVLLPAGLLILIFGILVKLESSGPMFYIHQRIGKDMKPFNCYKIRSMYYNPANSGKEFTELNDARITKIGKIIRRVRIDELPQIINILFNQMSWIGPRPLASIEYETSPEMFKERTLVKPGISGLAQVNGGSDLNNQEKLVYDIKYIQELSFKTDLKIVWQTIKVIFSGKGYR